MKYVAILLASLFFVCSMPRAGSPADLNVNIAVSAGAASDEQLGERSLPPDEQMEEPLPPDEQIEPLPPQYEEFEDEDFEGEAATPPPLEFATEPDMVVVPSGESYVYMVPGSPGLYFYGGGWYRNYRGRWYRSSGYNGSWASVGLAVVPRVVVGVPPEYVTFLPPTYVRIHYRDFHRGWRKWDHDRHWDKREWFKNERRSEVRRARFDNIRAERERVRRESHRRQRNDVDRRHPESGDRRGVGADHVKHPEGGHKRDAGVDRIKQGGQDSSKQSDKDKNKDKEKMKNNNKDKNKKKTKDKNTDNDQG